MTGNLDNVPASNGEARVIEHSGTKFCFGDRVYEFDGDVTSDLRHDDDVHFHPVNFPHVKMSATLNFLREQGVL